MRAKGKRGVALVLVLFVIFIQAVLGFAAVSIATLDSRAAAQEVLSFRALNMARAGISRAVAELRLDYAWPGNNVLKIFNLAGGSYSVQVAPASFNAGSVYKVWRVTSTGSFNGVLRIVEAWVQIESFARYAYFTNSEQGQQQQTIWFISNDKISGDAHTNGYFSMLGTPQFKARVTSHNKADAYFKQLTYDYTQGGQTYTDPAKFYRYSSGYLVDYPKALNGSPTFSFNGGQPEIPLPKDTGQIAANASYKYTGQVAITFNANGTMTVKEGIKAPITVPLSVTTIHVSGQVSVKGTVQGRVTLGATGGIDVIDNLVYADDDVDVLGMVSEGMIQVKVDPNVKKDISIDATIMTLNNSFTVDKYNQGTARGSLNVFGGIIQKNRGPVGTASGGSLATGYAKNYVYDEKLVNMPPPNFPTTGNIVPRSFIDRGALGN